jgi:hypothetical protein
LKDLAPLADRVWLVLDDAHELGSAEALAQLELLVMRAPAQLRVVLATRHDVRLGLHRLRLEGGLTEFRVADLRFTLDEARALFGGAGVELPAPALAMLYERTEGWAAGLRLAALSLAGHPDPERFAAEFSGSERTVAEYLLAEVLERQSEEVRRRLLRTSILDRVSGPLADALTGGSGGAGLAGAGGGERVCGVGGRGAVVVPLPPVVRRSAAVGAAQRRAGPADGAARRRRRVVCRARVSGGGGAPCPGRGGLGAGRAPAVGPLAGAFPQRAGRHRGRAVGQVP